MKPPLTCAPNTADHYVTSAVTPAAWLAIIEEVWGERIADKLDRVAIDWGSLHALLRGMDVNQVAILQMRFGEKRTFVDIGNDLGISRERVRMRLDKSLRMLRSGTRMRMMRSLIQGWWNLWIRHYPEDDLRGYNTHLDLIQS